MRVVNVQRAECHAYTTMFNYKLDGESPLLYSADRTADYAKCTFAVGGREKFVAYMESGTIPDFTEEIEKTETWMAEHGHKVTDWLWEGAINAHQRDLVFFKGGYAKEKLRWEWTEIKYCVTTLRPYALGGPNEPKPKMGAFHLNANPDMKYFEIIERGFKWV